MRTPPRWRHRRTGRRKPEVLEDGLAPAAFAEEREPHWATAAAVAGEQVLSEDPQQQLNDSSWIDSHVVLEFHDPGHVTPKFVQAVKTRMDRPGARAAALATLRGMHFAIQQT